MAIELGELEFDQIGDWPFVIRLVIIIVVCVAILGGGFYFLNMPQIEKLQKEQRKERDLMSELDTKQRKAANLDAYRKQIEEIERTFGTLLRKLPDKTEVPGLLEDISSAGVTSGLKVNIFKPLPENELSFYAELPIEIVVSGDYHQFGEFVSKISSLDRIVTVHDFAILVKGSKPSASNDDDVAKDELQMTMIAKTYRYKDEEEE